MAGEVLLRKGHMERDCLRRASIIAVVIVFAVWLKSEYVASLRVIV